MLSKWIPGTYAWHVRLADEFKEAAEECLVEAKIAHAVEAYDREFDWARRGRIYLQTAQMHLLKATRR